MDDPSLPSESLPSVWDRLRDSLEQLQRAASQRHGPEAREKKRQDRAKLLRRQVTTAAATGTSVVFLAFSRGQRRYGITVEHVLEVQALDEFTHVPGAPAAILGVVHWRGAILALLDLSILLDVAESGLSDLHAYVVVEAGGRRMALAASLVDDILAVAPDQLRAAPEMSGAIAPEWVIGIHDQNRLVLMVDEIFKHLTPGVAPSGK
jgi:purine-binding chemotaxis protein CheW